MLECCFDNTNFKLIYWIFWNEFTKNKISPSIIFQILYGGSFVIYNIKIWPIIFVMNTLIEIFNLRLYAWSTIFLLKQKPLWTFYSLTILFILVTFHTFLPSFCALISVSLFNSRKYFVVFAISLSIFIIKSSPLTWSVPNESHNLSIFWDWQLWASSKFLFSLHFIYYNS